MAQNISIIGSTGSIGRQTLEVVEAHPEEWSITALAAYENIDLLEEQIRQFNPEIVAVFDTEKAEILKKRVNIPVLSGEEGWIKVANHPSVQKTVFSSTGIAALGALYEAIRQKKQNALANKEMIVAEGQKMPWKGCRLQVRHSCCCS